MSCYDALMKVVGLDFGHKRIGVAVSDDRGVIAFPREIIPHTPTAHEVVQSLVEQEKATAIVVGESRDGKGGPNPITHEQNLFIERLRKHVSVPIYTEPEFFTSMHVEQTARAYDGIAKKGGKHKGAIDASAAALILQRYLDRRWRTS